MPTPAGKDARKRVAQLANHLDAESRAEDGEGIALSTADANDGPERSEWDVELAELKLRLRGYRTR